MYRTVLLLLLCVSAFRMGALAQSDSPAPTSPGAQVRLGNAYLDQNDYTSAMIWFRKAAEKGDAAAQNNIGWLYENGFGVKQDYAEALNWFSKAANRNNADAQNNIGWLYEKGWGVEQDFTEAMGWYRKAEFSKQATDAKYEGTCVLMLTVGADGLPKNIRVTKSLGMGLDEKAVETVQTWKFAPAMKDGQPVAAEIAVEVDFHLK